MILRFMIINKMDWTLVSMHKAHGFKAQASRHRIVSQAASKLVLEIEQK